MFDKEFLLKLPNDKIKIAANHCSPFAVIEIINYYLAKLNKNYNELSYNFIYDYFWLYTPPARIKQGMTVEEVISTIQTVGCIYKKDYLKSNLDKILYNSEYNYRTHFLTVKAMPVINDELTIKTKLLAGHPLLGVILNTGNHYISENGELILYPVTGIKNFHSTIICGWMPTGYLIYNSEDYDDRYWKYLINLYSNPFVLIFEIQFKENS